MAKEKCNKTQAMKILKYISEIIKASNVTGVKVDLVKPAGGEMQAQVVSKIMNQKEVKNISIAGLLPLQIPEKIFHELRGDIAENEKKILQKRLLQVQGCKPLYDDDNGDGGLENGE